MNWNKILLFADFILLAAFIYLCFVAYAKEGLSILFWALSILSASYAIFRLIDIYNRLRNSSKLKS